MSSSVNEPTQGRRDAADGATAADQYSGAGSVTGVGHAAAPTVVPTQRDDGIRWGPVWAGVVIALAIFLILEFFFFAVGVLDFGTGAGNSGTVSGIVTGIIGLVAFFIGGLTAGKTAMWRDAPNGFLHGVVVAALGLVLVLVASLLGGGALLGAAGNFASQFASLQSANPKVSPEQVNQAVTTAQHAAGWATLGLGLAVIAAGLGGLVGVRGHAGKDLGDSAHTVGASNRH